MQKCDIILTHSRTFFGTIVRWILNFFQSDDVRYSHVLIVENSETAVEANKTIRHTNIEKVLKSAKRYKIVRLKEITTNQQEVILKEIYENLGNDYSYWRAFLNLIDEVGDTSWFSKGAKYHTCSSFVSYLYEVGCQIEFNKTPWYACNPDDIDDHIIDNDNWTIVGEK